MTLYTKVHIECVHALGVSVEIELKMDWQGCKTVLIVQILHLSVNVINTMLRLCQHLV